MEQERENGDKFWSELLSQRNQMEDDDNKRWKFQSDSLQQQKEKVESLRNKFSDLNTKVASAQVGFLAVLFRTKSYIQTC